jgi:hypothetical protein
VNTTSDITRGLSSAMKSMSAVKTEPAARAAGCAPIDVSDTIVSP